MEEKKQVDFDKISIKNDIEMQLENYGDLVLRSRYYHSEMDGYQIRKGVTYDNLKESIVIFICDFDMFQKGSSIYTFENVCMEDNRLHLGDETVKVFINTRGISDEISPELKDIFAYFNGDSVSAEETSDKFVTELQKEVEKVKKNKEWRLEYMTLQMREMEKYEEGIAEGIEKGKAEGRSEGIRLTKSVLRLDAEGYAISDIATELRISEEEVRRILEE